MRTMEVTLALLALVCASFVSPVVSDIIIAEYIRGPNWLREASSRRQEQRGPSVNKLPPPPPINDVARYARYIVHYSEWTSVGHISHQNSTDWFPSSRVFSMADGPIKNSSGVPYIYTSLHDSVPRDLEKDPRCSMTMSLAQTDFCSNRQLDPEDPRCPQTILTGFFVPVKNNTAEWKFAQEALFSRHPEMESWPERHHFFFAKLDIRHVQIVNNIGGSKFPSVQDYFNSPPPMRQQFRALASEDIEELLELEGGSEERLQEIQVNMMN